VSPPQPSPQTGAGDLGRTPASCHGHHLRGTLLHSGPDHSPCSTAIYAGTLVLVGVGLLHRAALFLLYFPDLQQLITNNPDWLTGQFLTIPALSRHLAGALFLLQQTPPIPNLVLGIISKCTTWPMGVGCVLIALQALLSIAAVILMFRIQLVFGHRIWLCLVLPLIFLLSTDLVLMEYNSLGQTFYENLPMCLLLLATYLVLRLEHTGSVKYSGLLGLVTALLALSRATFSYFLVIPILFIVILRPPRLRRHLLAFFLFGVSLQLGWCAKNALLYGHPSLATSSWDGTNFEASLIKTGLGGLFLSSILADPAGYPNWFIAMNRREGLVPWNPAYVRYAPPSLLQRDRQIQEICPANVAAGNTYGQSTMSALYLRAYMKFARQYPWLVLRKFAMSYKLFWQPIRNYSYMYVDLFYTMPVIGNSFNIPAVLARIAHGDIPEPQHLMTERYVFLAPKPRNAKRINTYSLTLLPTLLLMINLGALHLLAPMLLVFALTPLGRRKGGLPVGYSFMLCAIGYVALVSNLAELGENMRFRLSVEPLIWVSSGIGFGMLHRLLWPERWRLARAIGAPSG